MIKCGPFRPTSMSELGASQGIGHGFAQKTLLKARSLHA
jgi:hypothetical protein